MRARTLCPLSSCTRNIVLGSASTTSPSTSIFSSLTANFPLPDPLCLSIPFVRRSPYERNSRLASPDCLQRFQNTQHDETAAPRRVIVAQALSTELRRVA